MLRGLDHEFSVNYGAQDVPVSSPANPMSNDRIPPPRFRWPVSGSGASTATPACKREGGAVSLELARGWERGWVWDMGMGGWEGDKRW